MLSWNGGWSDAHSPGGTVKEVDDDKRCPSISSYRGVDLDETEEMEKRYEERRKKRPKRSFSSRKISYTDQDASESASDIGPLSRPDRMLNKAKSRQSLSRGRGLTPRSLEEKVVYSEVKQRRKISETPGSRDLSKETKRSPRDKRPRRRVMSRARYFEWTVKSNKQALLFFSCFSSFLGTHFSLKAF